VSTEPLRATFTVTVETREGGDYYFDHDDLVANVIPWIEGGLSDRDDLTKVSVVAKAPLTLAQEIEQNLNKPRSGCQCSEGCPDEPCECGHVYHGHGRIDMGPLRCLNCDCNKYRPTRHYPRCGAWGGCPLPMGHNKGRADIPENHRTPKVELTEPDHPAAHALAQYIASHPASTVMAACRYLGWKMDFDLMPDDDLDLEDASTGLCITCRERIVWVDGLEVGRWDHFLDDPTDHEPQPAHCGCPAALLPQGDGLVSNCVVHGEHAVHRTAKGEGWTPGEEV
jgi:hypothetical protein